MGMSVRHARVPSVLGTSPLCPWSHQFADGSHGCSLPGTQEFQGDREPSVGPLLGQLPELSPWTRREAGLVLRRELKMVT